MRVNWRTKDGWFQSRVLSDEEAKALAKKLQADPEVLEVYIEG